MYLKWKKTNELRLLYVDSSSNADLLSSTCTTTVLVDLSLPTNETSYLATSTK